MISGWLRMIFALGAFTAWGLVAVIYVEAALPIIDMGTGNGELTGTFSKNITQLESVIPPLVALVFLGIVVYVVVAGVREERSVNRRPPR